MEEHTKLYTFKDQVRRHLKAAKEALQGDDTVLYAFHRGAACAYAGLYKMALELIIRDKINQAVPVPKVKDVDIHATVPDIT